MGRALCTGLILGLLLIGGCGKTDQDAPPRFNETLGGSAVGAPPGTGTIDAGILKDPASYKPAAFEPLTPAPAAAEAESPEAQAAHAAVNQTVDALFGLDFATLIDAFPADAVKTLKQDDYVDNLNALSDAIGRNTSVFKEKATGPELQAIAGIYDFLPTLAEPLKNAFVIQVIDEQTARATFDPSRIPPEMLTQLMAKAQPLMAMAASLAPGQGMPVAAPGTEPSEPAAAEGEEPAAEPMGRPSGRTSRRTALPAEEGTPGEGATPEAPAAAPEAAMPAMGGPSLEGMLSQAALPAIPLRKIGDAWKIDLPLTFTDEQAELINELVVEVKAMFDETTQAMEQAATLDLQTYSQISNQIQARHMPVFMGLFGRAMPLFAPLMETPPAEGAATPPAEKPTEEDDNP